MAEKTFEIEVVELQELFLMVFLSAAVAQTRLNVRRIFEPLFSKTRESKWCARLTLIVMPKVTLFCDSVHHLPITAAVIRLPPQTVMVLEDFSDFADVGFHCHHNTMLL